MDAGQWVLLVLAVVAAAAAYGLWYWRSRVGRELALMASTETSRAADVASQVAGSVVEVKGTLKTAAPLTSEFAKVPAIYYRALTEAEVERVEHNKGGRETKREFETLSDVSKFAPAFVEDATGRVEVNLEGAKVEAKQVFRKREAEGLRLGSAISSVLNVSGRTVGHRYTEWVVPPDTQIYILGTVAAGGKVGKSTGKAQPFIVSIRSEEERTKAMHRTRLWLLLGAAAALIVAGLLLAATFGAFG